MPRRCGNPAAADQNETKVRHGNPKLALGAMDIGLTEGDNVAVAETASFPHRVFLADVRDNGAYIRVTWHAEQATFVVSHWDDRGCIAATRIGAGDVPQLVSLLANGLADALAREQATPRPSRVVAPAWRAKLKYLAKRLRRSRRAADVLPLRLRELPDLDELRWMSETS